MGWCKPFIRAGSLWLFSKINSKFFNIIGQFPNILNAIKAVAILIFIFLAISPNHLIYSQETENSDSGQRSNDKFYPHNYARSPLESAKTPGASPKAEIKDTKKGPESLGSNDKSSSIVPNNEPSGKQIASISLIISGLDHKALEKSTEVMLTLFNEKAVRPSTIFIIGQSSELMQGQLNANLKRLSLLGVGTQVSMNPPNNFRVKKLPSWIITTADGDIVLEGLNSPAKFINSKAEFIDPKDLPGGELAED